MNITYHEASGIFSLRTEHTLYQMQADPTGHLLHLYYGLDTGDGMDYLVRCSDHGFSGNPYDQRANRGYSLDTLPQECSVSGTGDYRISALKTVDVHGSRSAELLYDSHRIIDGREPLEGLPYVHPAEDTQTLEITLKDPVIGLKVILLYHVFPETDVITRSGVLINESSTEIVVEKAASACVDIPYGTWDVIHFHGRHCMERMPERQRLGHGVTAFGSRRGMSSHHSNPFVILAAPTTGENQGECMSVMLMYSGNHLEEMEVDQTESTRLVAGIHPDGFSWHLGSGEKFSTPEAIISYSARGLNGLSQNLHELIRKYVIPEPFRKGIRPVLLNSWEAMYFDFDAEKILSLARSAAELGMEMLVLDDGWFGKRDDDNSGLGDWVVNESKLGCPLSEVSKKIHAMGLKFGLWFEPEMINEDSDLFRSHPEYAVTDPGRKPVMARNQMVLDMSRKEVVDYLYQAMTQILDHVEIEYVKWDFNRSIANAYSSALSAAQQGEVLHRFILGTYDLLERLRSRYPSLLIEGCSGGGGRFDAGMLFYCPQIWCSDDTDAIERLEIQRGTSYGYPVSTMGAHVSAVPNHQSGRVTGLKTRGIVAQSGTFGYELNPGLLSDAEKETIRGQIRDYRQYAELINYGTYYRLTELEHGDFEAWMFVSPDKQECLVNVVCTHVRVNGPYPFVRLMGLDPQARYCLETEKRTFTGAALMYGGFSLPQFRGEDPAVQLYFRQEAI